MRRRELHPPFRRRGGDLVRTPLWPLAGAPSQQHRRLAVLVPGARLTDPGLGNHIWQRSCRDCASSDGSTGKTCRSKCAGAPAT